MTVLISEHGLELCIHLFLYIFDGHLKLFLERQGHKGDEHDQH